MSLNFHLVVFDVDPGNENIICKRVGPKMFLRILWDGKVLRKIFHNVLKKDVWCRGV